MESIKQYVRSGLLAESKGYEIVMEFDGRAESVDKIIVVLEGRCRRKLELKAGRTLYENYYPLSFLGLEDYLLGRSYKGKVGMFPGAHYCIWEVDDFQHSLGIHSELARHAIHQLSRRVRLYDAKSGHETSTMGEELKDLELENLDADISDMLFSFNFSEEDVFPSELVQKLSRKFSSGEYLMKQGEKSLELYIILSGKVKVIHKSDGKTRKENWLGANEMVGEMAQFDGLARSADVIAVEETEVLAFSPEYSYLLFQLHPRWSMKILQTLASRIEQRRKEFTNMDMKSGMAKT